MNLIHESSTNEVVDLLFLPFSLSAKLTDDLCMTITSLIIVNFPVAITMDRVVMDPFIELIIS